MSFLKKLVPQFLLRFIRPVYHGCLAYFACMYFGQPGKKMTVVGITGTVGKSTTVQMLSRILNQAGRKTGFITTISFFDGTTEILNKHGLSMPGGWLLQKHLRQMLDNGCSCAVIECTSEGLAQNRHVGVDFDMALLTNLSEAHVEAHKGFENYLKAKQKLFGAIKVRPLKPNGAKKIIGLNLDDRYWERFSHFFANQVFGITLDPHKHASVGKIFAAQNAGYQPLGFDLQGVNFQIPLPGQFNIYNALMAASAAGMLGVKMEDASKALAAFNKIRGRMERVENTKGLEIFVDYGCEPASFEAALKSASSIPHKKLIHVFGSTGGHRDSSKRSAFGGISAKYSNHIIVTNDDVYDSDPEKIAQDIEAGIVGSGLWKGKKETILDRREAIKHALKIAEAGDMVLITGKGSEQFLVLPGNRRIEWDEVSVVKELLNKA